MIENVHWLGHGSFLIDGDIRIYVDPWRVVGRASDADVILISHDHFDHCSVADVSKLRNDGTQVISNARVAEQIADVTVIRSWQSITIDKVGIKAIPAYSPEGFQHPEEHDGLGFVISMNYFDIYYAGDTRLIPDMERIHPDIAILPIDDNDTLDVEEAAQVVSLLRPRWVIPCNWGDTGIGASAVDAQDFKKQVGHHAEVVIPTQAGNSTQD